MKIHHSPEFRLIHEIYGTRRAKRSGVPLINHILEGLQVLKVRGASEFAKRAYCLHPVVQGDADLKKNLVRMDLMPNRTLLLAMEYRSVANAYLSDREIDSWLDIRLSPLRDVNEMLVADKVQNYKDFCIYHEGVHPRSKELDAYFNNWFKRLNIDRWGNNLSTEPLPEWHRGK